VERKKGRPVTLARGLGHERATLSWVKGWLKTEIERNEQAMGARGASKGVVPALISSRHAPPITLVGYGQSSATTPYNGLRRFGYNTIDSVHATSFYFTGASGSEAATCYGDSGGPAYRTGTQCLVGITHGNRSASCVSGIWDDSRVDGAASWIVQNAGESIATCAP
jgi:hypothetical protein